jgi:hypothetical protein
VEMKSRVFCYMVPRILINSYRCFGGQLTVGPVIHFLDTGQTYVTVVTLNDTLMSVVLTIFVEADLESCFVILPTSAFKVIGRRTYRKNLKDILLCVISSLEEKDKLFKKLRSLFTGSETVPCIVRNSLSFITVLTTALHLALSRTR